MFESNSFFFRFFKKPEDAMKDAFLVSMLYNLFLWVTDSEEK